MADRFVLEPSSRSSFDMYLMLLLVLLVGIGLTALFSASYYYGELNFSDSFYFIKKDGLYILVGIALGLLLMNIPLDMLRQYIPHIILATLVMVFLPFVPGLGKKILGAQRWIIVFGRSFQPSELAKLSLVLYLAHIFDKKSDRINDFANTIFPPLIITGIMVFIIYGQNDFSTSFFILFVAIAMFFVAGVSLYYFLFLIASAVPLAIILVFTKEHRVERIITYLRPEIDPMGTGYQVLAAKDALLRGGFFGVGLGQGVEKIGGLPEAHSDFVFAVLAEESGLIGVVVIIGLFVLFAVQGYRISLLSGSRFSFLLGFGITSMIFLQAVFNFAVVAGLVPTTGIPLPFFSSGGSSKLVSLMMCGLLLNISRYAERRGLV
ncbi:MAG: putative lipid II flippase FtsW [Spirochaetales bacterium]|nr:putative lipid II flippase FtsW [Spirochaetales bacterium]